MFEIPQSVKVLGRVLVRLRLVSFGSRFYAAFLACSALYAVALLGTRLCGVVTDWFTPVSLAVVPATAFLVALVFHRRPTPLDAARVIDGHQGTKDLFLTVALIEKTAGEYQALVASAAERQATRVKPTVVVPFAFARRFGSALAAGLAIVAAMLWMPHFDPFGKIEAAQQEQKRHEQLEESRKIIKDRTAALKKDETEGPLSEETQKAVEELKQALKQMKPQERKENFRELGEQQRSFEGKWKKLNTEKLSGLMAQNPQVQQFGAVDREKLERWTRELQEGSTKSLQNELEALKEELKELSKTTDPVKKAELEQKVKKRMKELSEFASDRANSKPLTAALQRAMKELEAAKQGKDGEKCKECLGAAADALDLAKLELKELAQSAKDLQALEEALKVIQQAKALADKEKLDGEGTEGLDSLEDYAEYYAELMAQLGLSEGDGEGEGDGMGDRGMGRGGVAPEDESTASDFKTEHSKSAVTAGKVLLSTKIKGLSDKGDARKEYRTLIEKVKQGYSEAILQEQIPPGYHDQIKTYFDSLEKSAKGGAGPVGNGDGTGAAEKSETSTKREESE
jgi:hypothetical protein